MLVFSRWTKKKHRSIPDEIKSLGSASIRFCQRWAQSTFYLTKK